MQCGQMPMALLCGVFFPVDQFAVAADGVAGSAADARDQSGATAVNGVITAQFMWHVAGLRAARFLYVVQAATLSMRFLYALD